MAALNDDALFIEYANVWVGDDAGSLVDMGAVRNVRFTAEQITQVINSDNRGEILRKSRMPGRVEFELLELGDADTLENIFKGLLTKSAVAASIVNNYSQVEASGEWAYNTFIPFDFQDGDGTAPNIDSVTAGTNGALTVNVDYIVTQHAGRQMGNHDPRFFDRHDPDADDHDPIRLHACGIEGAHGWNEPDRDPTVREADRPVRR